MENASKALIIAGAILLSILIISLGIMVYNNSKNTVGSANLSKQEISTFNSQWESYQGTNKTASEVQTMISAVIANNAAERQSGTGREVNVNGRPVTSVSTLNTQRTYSITPEYDPDTGLITNIAYSQNSASTTGGTSGGGQTTNP